MCSKQAATTEMRSIVGVMSCHDISVLQRAIHISRSIVLLIMQFSREWVVAWLGREVNASVGASAFLNIPMMTVMMIEWIS